MTLAKGFGLWAYPVTDDERAKVVTYVNNFNAQVITDAQIRYLYVSVAGVESYDNEIYGDYDTAYFYNSATAIMAYYKSNIPGIQVGAMFESDKETAEHLSDISASASETLGNLIASLANNNSYVDIVQFDIEPFRTGQGRLIEYTASALEKPLGVALGNFTDDGFFGSIDIPTIMNYDQCVGSLSSFASVTANRASAFYALCTSYGITTPHYGIAAVKTFCEPAALKYTRASYDVYKSHETASLGMAIYAMFAGEKIHPKKRFKEQLWEDYSV